MGGVEWLNNNETRQLWPQQHRKDPTDGPTIWRLYQGKLNVGPAMTQKLLGTQKYFSNCVEKMAWVTSESLKRFELRRCLSYPDDHGWLSPHSGAPHLDDIAKLEPSPPHCCPLRLNFPNWEACFDVVWAASFSKIFIVDFPARGGKRYWSIVNSSTTRSIQLLILTRKFGVCALIMRGSDANLGKNWASGTCTRLEIIRVLQIQTLAHVL